jgi:hypothetical protein
MNINTSTIFDKNHPNYLSNKNKAIHYLNAIERTEIDENKRTEIDENNVIRVAQILKKHVLPYCDTRQLRFRYRHIVHLICNKKSHFMRYIHRFAIKGDDIGVKALVELNSYQAYIESNVLSNRPALSYALEYNHPIISDYLKKFIHSNTLPLFTIDRLEHIQCTRGRPPKNLSFVMGLIHAIGLARLSVTHSFSTQGVTYYFTQTFTYKSSSLEKRPLVICFVEKDSKLYPKLFWLSQSQNIWRRTDKIFKNWIGKSKRGEGALALPIEVNIKLFKIHTKTQDERQFRDLPSDLGKKLLGYIVAWSDSKVGDEVLKNGRRVLKILGAPPPDDTTEIESGSLSNEIERAAWIGPEELSSNPESIYFFNENEAPDFSKCFSRVDTKSPLYGRLTASIFLSYNRKIRYLFLERKETQHVFLATAEIVNAPITKLGLKRKWIDSGSLALPLLEYPEQFFLNSSRLRNQFWSRKAKELRRNRSEPDYVCTWNYLRKVPFIKGYYKQTKRSVPPAI